MHRKEETEVGRELPPSLALSVPPSVPHTQTVTLPFLSPLHYRQPYLPLHSLFSAVSHEAGRRLHAPHTHLQLVWLRLQQEYAGIHDTPEDAGGQGGKAGGWWWWFVF